MKQVKTKPFGLIIVLTAFFMLMGTFSAQAALRTRIAVLPFYVEQGREANANPNIGLHYRRMSGFIENQLVRHNFEVIDPFAKDSSEKELNRVMQKAKEDSVLVSTNMCQRYGVDAVYIVWLDVKAKKTADGYWKANAILDGTGYDSGGRSLGANVMKTFKVTRSDFDEAVAVVEKEVGDVVGRVLTEWNGQRSANVVRTNSGTSQGQGILAKNISSQAKYINLRLDQANEYELVEVFGKVVNTVRGVTQARQYSSRIIRDNPQACFTEWEVEIDTNQTESFRLQANIMKMINDIIKAGGTITIKGVPYRYTPAEVHLLKGFYPGETTSRSIQFIVDREKARDSEFTGKHSKPGFE